MGENTGISWTDSTWNPTVGCSRVSAGCDHCYAIRDSARQVGAKHPAYEGVLTIGNRDWSGRVNLVPERLGQPLRWKRPRRIFVNSMSDLFHPEIPVEYIAQVFGVMSMASWHQFQVLTKRPQRMAEVLADPAFPAMVADAATELWRSGSMPKRGDACPAPGGWFATWPTPPAWLVTDVEDDRGTARWPIPNVWLGTSIESGTYAWRSRHLLETPAAVRFVSAEPLLTALDLAPYMTHGGLDWVIVGGESGPGARPMDLAWVEQLVEQCHAEGVAVFVKQLGNVLAGELGVHGKGTQPDEWPESIRFQEWPTTEAVPV